MSKNKNKKSEEEQFYDFVFNRIAAGFDGVIDSFTFGVNIWIIFSFLYHLVTGNNELLIENAILLLIPVIAIYSRRYLIIKYPNKKVVGRIFGMIFTSLSLFALTDSGEIKLIFLVTAIMGFLRFSLYLRNISSMGEGDDTT